MQNIKLTLAYDGTRYAGWQKTADKITIEETLQEILEKVFGHPIGLQAASRTDAGVHADGQVVNFLTTKDIDTKKLLTTLSCLLPRDLIALDVEIVPLKFHPTLDCLTKEYHYDLCYGRVQRPKDRFYAWHYPHLLDIDKMNEAASFFIGEYDFSAFCNLKSKEEYANYVRNLAQIDIIPSKENNLKFIIVGNNFLYRMVRNLVGTLVYVGVGKINTNNLSVILENKDRRLIGPTAPAHGLTLHKVNY